MLTLCPHCRTVFRVRAAQLTSARGFVECSACERVFDALENLADETPSADAAAKASDGAPRAARDDDAARRDVAHARDSEGPRVGAATLEEVEIADGEPPLPRIAPIDLDLRRDDEHDAVPSVLREDLARLAAQERGRGQFAWSILALVLLFALAAQGVWHWRAELVTRFPQWAPYATQLCAHFGCRIEQPMEIADIALVARDVRDHPQYAHTLLVNATLENRGPRAAKFPVIQLGVYDRGGVAIGVRRFTPQEYLDRSIDIDAGMPPAGRVYIVLEIADVDDRADSFEFLFL